MTQKLLTIFQCTSGHLIHQAKSGFQEAIVILHLYMHMYGVIVKLMPTK